MEKNPPAIILVSCPAYHRTPMLKFANGRDFCREQIRLAAKQASLKILYYIITRDRFVLLLKLRKLDTIGTFLRKVKVTVAEQYRQAKHCEGPFWKARNPITLIQPGQTVVDCIRAMTALVPYSQACLPEQWSHIAYHEIIGTRKRYRLIDMHALTKATGCTTEQLQQVVLELHDQQDDPIKPWVDATAVGTHEWIGTAAENIARTSHKIVTVPPQWHAIHTAPRARRQYIKAVLKAIAKSSP